MTPAALRKLRTQLGLSTGALGRAAGYRTGSVVAALERLPPQRVPYRTVRMALLERRCRVRDDRLRTVRRARSAKAWAGDFRRQTLEAAADRLDAAGETVLADWLLRARPDRAVEVATYTAVHTLLRVEPDVFDILREGGLIDDDVFMDAYLWETREFVWSPERDHLLL